MEYHIELWYLIYPVVLFVIFTELHDEHEANVVPDEIGCVLPVTVKPVTPDALISVLP
jgi:hypothetical protein